MEHHRLLLLGLLKTQEQHGYQLMDFVERNLSRIANVKKATVYYDLKRLEQERLVTVRMEQDEGRPPRRVYSLTDAGEQAFLEALAENLGQVDCSPSASDIGLMFMDWLPPATVRQRVQEKLKGLRARLEQVRATPSHGKDSAVDLAISYIIARLESDIAWFESLVERLAAKEVNQP